MKRKWSVITRNQYKSPHTAKGTTCGGLGCCPFLGGGSIVVNLLFGVLPIGCGGSVFVFCFVVHYFVSFQVLQSS